ncbi:Tripartite DNA replication factor [Actinomortierella ambigua]|nr:Tripartite DNA replication factor [Actinomortierella ambigua]
MTAPALSVFYEAASSSSESLSFSSLDITHEELDLAFAELNISSALTARQTTVAQLAAVPAQPVPAHPSHPASTSSSLRVNEEASHSAQHQPLSKEARMYVPRRRPLPGTQVIAQTPSSKASRATLAAEASEAPRPAIHSTSKRATSKASLPPSSSETSTTSEGGLDGLADALASIKIGAQLQKSEEETPQKQTPPPPPHPPAPELQRHQRITTTDVNDSATAQASSLPPQGREKDGQKSAKFKFSPSVLAHHANTSCEKMLHLSGLEAFANAQHPKPFDHATSTRPSTIAEANTQRGNKFEENIIRSLPNRVECDKEKDTDSYFRLATEPFGTTLCQAVFALDESFYTPSMKKAGIVFGRFIPDFIRILPGSRTSDGRQKRKLFIIDAKSSKHVKLSHEVQVTLYAIFLEHLIKVHRQDDLIEVDTQGGVWLPASKEPYQFSLAFMRPAVKDFLYQDLPAILLKPLNQAVWHVHAPCNQCNYLEQCKKEAKEQRTLSLVPGLSKSHATWIRSLFRSPPLASEMEDIEDLFNHRQSLPLDDMEMLLRCLETDSDGQSALLSVYKTKKIKIKAKPTLSLPRMRTRRLLINVLMDPLSQLPFAYSLGYYMDQLASPSKSAFGAVNISNEQEFPSRADFVQLTEELIETLREWLVQFSDANITLAVFFASQNMCDEFMSLLIRIISKGENDAASSPSPVRNTRPVDDWSELTVMRAMQLLSNLFEDGSLVTLPDTARYPIQLPDYLSLLQGYDNKKPSFCRRSFSLDKAVKELVVMPVIGNISFADIKTHLLYHGDEDAEGPAGMRMPSTPEDLYHQWSQTGSADSVCKVLREWLDQQNLVILSLYSLLLKEQPDLRHILIAPQAVFRMRGHFNIQSRILAQFAFFLIWETITSIEQKRDRRIASIKNEDSFRKQQAFRVQFLERHLGAIPDVKEVTAGSTSPPSNQRARPKNVFKEPSNLPSSKYVGKFRVVSPCSSENFDGGSFPKWIISPETAAGLLKRVQYDNMGSILRSYGFPDELPAIVSVLGFDPADMTIYIQGGYELMTSYLELKEGETYILEQREYSPTLKTSLTVYSEVQGNGNVFLDLLHDPNRWGVVAPEDAFLLKEATTKSPVRQYGMTSSQEDAFTSVLMNRLRIIWGPPGSGKTFFLASTILRFVDSMIRLATDRKIDGRDVTIILTAFTHSAVDNLVERIVQLHKDIAPRDGCERYIRPLNIFRIVGTAQVAMYTQTMPSEVRVCDSQKLKTAAKNGCGNGPAIRIVAGTVWQVRKASSEKDGASFMKQADMVMIDEGSQLLAADAFHVIECLNRENGRLIVAGDHMQLRPVIVGSYPKSKGHIDPTGSIMANLMRDRNGAPVPDHWMESFVSSFPDVGPCTSQLLDNFRMNKQLGEFMKRIYGPNYQVYMSAEKTLPYSTTFDWNVAPNLRTILDPSRSAVCVELAVTGPGRLATMARTDNREGAKIEAKFVAGIAEAYLQAVGRTTKTSLFIAVPHHVQRMAILRAVSQVQSSATTSTTASKTTSWSSPPSSTSSWESIQVMYPNATIKIDTIEKMQGQEADLVIACFALFDENALLSQMEFLYNINRWVVGLSRARCKTIVMVSPEILAPKMIMGSSSTPSSSSFESRKKASATTTSPTSTRSSSKFPPLKSRRQSQQSIHTNVARQTVVPMEMNGTGQAASISQRPAVRASDEASKDGWGLLRAFEEYATSLGAKQTWPLTEEVLQGLDLDSL